MYVGCYVEGGGEKYVVCGRCTSIPRLETVLFKRSFSSLAKPKTTDKISKFLTVVLWHVDPLIGNGREIRSYTTTVVK
jgi:hypothetical protein